MCFKLGAQQQMWFAKVELIVDLRTRYLSNRVYNQSNDSFLS